MWGNDDINLCLGKKRETKELHRAAVIAKSNCYTISNESRWGEITRIEKENNHDELL